MQLNKNHQNSCQKTTLIIALIVIYLQLLKSIIKTFFEMNNIWGILSNYSSFYLTKYKV
jgi:ABC-type xylose transport system permease subunit